MKPCIFTVSVKFLLDKPSGPYAFQTLKRTFESTDIGQRTHRCYRTIAHSMIVPPVKDIAIYAFDRRSAVKGLRQQRSMNSR